MVIKVFAIFLAAVTLLGLNHANGQQQEMSQSRAASDSLDYANGGDPDSTGVDSGEPTILRSDQPTIPPSEYPLTPPDTGGVAYDTVRNTGTLEKRPGRHRK